MITTVQKWGNSLGVRIPSPVAKDVKLSEGSRVEIREEGNRLVIVPVEKPVFALEDMLKKIKKEHIPSEVDFGPAKGREVW
jgi:antitoxin MazE